MYPSPDVETKIIEQSLNDDFSDISWNQLLLRRFLIVLLMIFIFIVGIVCRILIPVPDHVSHDNYADNATINVVSANTDLTTPVPFFNATANT